MGQSTNTKALPVLGVIGAKKMAQLVKGLLSKQEDKSSDLQHPFEKSDMKSGTFISSTQV